MLIYSDLCIMPNIPRNTVYMHVFFHGNLFLHLKWQTDCEFWQAPLSHFINMSFLFADGTLKSFLTNYPYAPPCLINCIVLLLGVLSVIFLLPETLNR